MPLERTVRRYTAYFKGWCQAFGEHEAVALPGDDIICLFSEDQIGFILPHGLFRSLYPEVLGRQHSKPLLDLDSRSVRLGRFRHVIPEIWQQRGLPLLNQLMQSGKDLHLYLTYHITYPSGTRIITFSQRYPLPIIYKEIDPIDIRLTLSRGDR